MRAALRLRPDDADLAEALAALGLPPATAARRPTSPYLEALDRERDSYLNREPAAPPPAAAPVAAPPEGATPPPPAAAAPLAPPAAPAWPEALAPAQRKALHDALLQAFPTTADLELMVSYQIDANLADIAEGNTLSQTVFALIRWAHSRGRVGDLIAGALAANATSPALRKFAAGLGHPMSAPPGAAPLAPPAAPPGDDPAALRAEIARLHDALAAAEKAAAVAVEREKAARAELARERRARREAERRLVKETAAVPPTPER